LASATISPGGVRQAATDGSTLLSEMKDTSAQARVTAKGRISGVR
jgi:hypothetical protein